MGPSDSDAEADLEDGMRMKFSAAGEQAKRCVKGREFRVCLKGCRRTVMDPFGPIKPSSNSRRESLEGTGCRRTVMGPKGVRCVDPVNCVISGDTLDWCRGMHFTYGESKNSFSPF
jgi:hypothetical protein